MYIRTRDELMTFLDFANFVLLLIPAGPGILLSLAALRSTRNAFRRRDLRARRLWWRAVLMALFGLLSCPGGVIAMFLLALTYADSPANRACMEATTAASVYCQWSYALSFAFWLCIAALLILAVTNIVLLPTLILWRWHHRGSHGQVSFSSLT
jgi:hypothetical protein